MLSSLVFLKLPAFRTLVCDFKENRIVFLKNLFLLTQMMLKMYVHTKTYTKKFVLGLYITATPDSTGNNLQKVNDR